MNNPIFRKIQTCKLLNNPTFWRCVAGLFGSVPGYYCGYNMLSSSMFNRGLMPPASIEDVPKTTLIAPTLAGAALGAAFPPFTFTVAAAFGIGGLIIAHEDWSISQVKKSRGE